MEMHSQTHKHEKHTKMLSQNTTNKKQHHRKYGLTSYTQSKKQYTKSNQTNIKETKTNKQTNTSVHYLNNRNKYANKLMQQQTKTPDIHFNRNATKYYKTYTKQP
jgi:hypothetical protein